MKSILNSKNRVIILQLLGWGVILGISLFWGVSSDNIFDSFGMLMLIVNILTLLFIYLMNYLLFIPRFLLASRQRWFFFSNFVLIAGLLTFTYLFNEGLMWESLRPENIPQRPRGSMVMYLVRDFINYVLMIGLVTALRLAQRLQRSEEALKEAESARTKAELLNLKSQINPHFLLNTLNNIYALTAIDTDKAQKTIKELSNLLRYILYDNLNEIVPLKGEVDFLKTYIELMSIRLPRKVRVTTEFNISNSSATMIAPLIFISLIENAFKHSVSASGEGFIEIYFEDNSELGEVMLSIKNSNHAKRDEDKSGHGIGLEQVRRRLELLYTNRHSWVIDSNQEYYSSILTLRGLLKIDLVNLE
ncbi:MAG: sensor histidine kinase [Rikenellaceae bacterium]